MHTLSLIPPPIRQNDALHLKQNFADRIFAPPAVCIRIFLVNKSRSLAVFLFCGLTVGAMAAFASTDGYESSAKPDKVIKVAAIAGSLRKASFNRGLIRCAIEIAREFIPHMVIDYVDIGDLPFVNTDLEVNNRFPDSVEKFREKILQADCILFASPEYNYSVTGPLKNAIDWGSRPPNVWADKPAAIMSAGGGFGGGLSQYHLRQIGVYIDLHFINKPELCIHAFQSPLKFDGAGNLIDTDTKERVKALLLSLHAFTIRLQNKKKSFA